jgi:hypothetical protein
MDDNCRVDQRAGSVDAQVGKGAPTIQDFTFVSSMWLLTFSSSKAHFQAHWEHLKPCPLGTLHNHGLTLITPLPLYDVRLLPEIEEFWRHRATWSFSTARFPRSHWQRSPPSVDGVPKPPLTTIQCHPSMKFLLCCKTGLVLHNQILSCRKMWIWKVLT